MNLENELYKTDFDRLGIFANGEDDSYDEMNKQKDSEPKPKGWRWSDLVTPSRKKKEDKPKYQPPEVEYHGDVDGDY